ncbi:hypothetical protein MKL09_24185 [Methylobacterium sp. J-048]|uniref:hypothetical protein n=1 Tax=unclassified Methylobacterium TaxID=2615210 RepID=UPI001FB93838|nr:MULTISPECIES: hypothetical protein [unclassified Methylobacterium]MCJ2059626.1 hypothetical protein [Methylobacterium sp. J-048]MCJ2141522.1 hypothetical protein [Methylobacterium sp. E-066]
MDTLDPHTDRHAAALNRLAHTLDVPVAEFFGEPANHEADDLLALVRLWSEIEGAQGRGRVLEIARQEAERGGYKGCA